MRIHLQDTKSSIPNKKNLWKYHNKRKLTVQNNPFDWLFLTVRRQPCKSRTAYIVFSVFHGPIFIKPSRIFGWFFGDHTHVSDISFYNCLRHRKSLLLGRNLWFKNNYRWHSKILNDNRSSGMESPKYCYGEKFVTETYLKKVLTCSL